MNQPSTQAFKIFLTLLLIVSMALIITAGFQHTISAGSSEVYRELKIFTNIIEELEGSYVDEVDTKKLIESAIKGMVGSLDPHSQYLPPDAFHDLQSDTRGEFEGLGIVITKPKGILKIISPIEGTPAFRAGVKPGDIISKIDGEPTEDMELWEAVKKMRGEKGTSVEITILREGEPEALTYTLVRDVIPITSVKSIMLKPGYGYVWITNFQSNTTDELTTALDALEDENDGHLKGLILDLRNNPGGLLDQALSVPDIFLDGGLLLTVKERKREQTYRARGSKKTRSCPLIVLINGGSASASEIVAGALQDNKRALILGTPSFGKGSVQTIKPLGDGSGIKYTIARYYTPDGTSIQAKGITPDIQVAHGTIDPDQGISKLLKEKDLKNHLEADPDKPDESENDTREEETESTRYDDLNLERLLSDAQVIRALDTLISYEIFKNLQ